MKTILKGKMSTFGGPHDMGIKPDEGLALVDAGNYDEVVEYFLTSAPPNTTGLARRLDPQKYYLACRWDYATTPKRYLTKILVEVTNPSNNKTAHAKPVDWGPAAWTGRVADLSPGLATFLGLETDDICEVEIVHPGVELLNKQQHDIAEIASGPHLSVLTEAEIKVVFGNFEYKESSTTKGGIVITQPWPQNNLANITVPQLKGLPYYGGPSFSGNFICHNIISKPLQDAFIAIEQQGLHDLLLFWGGCHVPRHKSWNPNRGLSSHSWGIAIDINPQWNAYDREPASKGAEGSVVELVSIFESFGFAWGGYFSVQDGMHFEFARKQ